MNDFDDSRIKKEYTHRYINGRVEQTTTAAGKLERYSWHKIYTTTTNAQKKNTIKSISAIECIEQFPLLPNLSMETLFREFNNT